MTYTAPQYRIKYYRLIWRSKLIAAAWHKSLITPNIRLYKILYPIIQPKFNTLYRAAYKNFMPHLNVKFSFEKFSKYLHNVKFFFENFSNEIKIFFSFEKLSKNFLEKSKPESARGSLIIMKALAYKCSIIKRKIAAEFKKRRGLFLVDSHFHFYFLDESDSPYHQHHSRLDRIALSFFIFSLFDHVNKFCFHIYPPLFFFLYYTIRAQIQKYTVKTLSF